MCSRGPCDILVPSILTRNILQIGGKEYHIYIGELCFAGRKNPSSLLEQITSWFAELTSEHHKLGFDVLP